MAKGTTQSSNGNVTIKPGLRADIMRNLMETKDTLTSIGSLYVGTGETITLGPSGDTITSYTTKELKTGGSVNVNKVLTVKSDGDLEYKFIDADSFGGSTQFENLIKPYTGTIQMYTGDSTSVSMKMYVKKYTSFTDFSTDSDLAKAADPNGNGCIVSASFITVNGSSGVSRSYAVAISPRASSDYTSQNAAAYYDPVARAWLEFNSSIFTSGCVLKVIFIKE